MDRNVPGKNLINGICLSLSARRAWIEIGRHRRFEFFRAVALRKESVDRNDMSLPTYHPKFGSLSARRAWIEISKYAL